MYGCTVCNNRKSVLNTEPEFDFRRRKPNTEEMQTYGVSNYCSACQRVTFFVNLLDFEDPLRLRNPLAWNLICAAAAEKLGKIPLQDAEVQTRSSDIYREALAPPASRERAGQMVESEDSKESSVDLRIRETAIQLNVESEESSSSLSAIDSRTTGIINSALYSETDSGTSRKDKDIKVLYRRPSNLNKDRQSSTRKISGVGHVSARLVPSGGLLLQRKMMEMRKQRKIEEKRKRLEELDSIMCRIQAKTTKLRTEMLALEDSTQQLGETVERKSRRQREAAGALVGGNSWWGRENLERVFGKWSPERRDSKMEEGADILMQAIQENSGSKEQERHTDQKDQRTRKECTHRDPSGTKDHRSRKDLSGVSDRRSKKDEKDLNGATDRRTKKVEKDLIGVTDRRSKKDQKDLSGVSDRRSRKDQKDLSGATDRRSKKDQKDERTVKDQKDDRAVKAHRETDIDEPWSMHNLYIHLSPSGEHEEKGGALLCDSNSFRDNERLRCLLESPKAKPQTMRICREPITCPICPECQQQCFVSDFNTHVQRDHPNVMLERISVGQTKTFHLDLRLTRKNQPMCHMIYFVKDMIIDPQGHMQDLLPVLVMTARIDTGDVVRTKDAPEDDAMQFLLVWLCSYRPTNDRVIGTLSVEATCADLADSLTVRTARAYDIRGPQDMRSIFCSSSTLIVPYNFVRRIAKRGNHSLTVSVKIE